MEIEVHCHRGTDEYASFSIAVPRGWYAMPVQSILDRFAEVGRVRLMTSDGIMVDNGAPIGDLRDGAAYFVVPAQAELVGGPAVDLPVSRIGLRQCDRCDAWRLDWETECWTCANAPPDPRIILGLPWTCDRCATRCMAFEPGCWHCTAPSPVAADNPRRRGRTR